MPTSAISMIEPVLTMIETATDVDTILDVGPGHGKYSILCREYLNRKPTRIDAVEAWPPYITEHNLVRLYDEVIGGDVCELEHFDYDLVLMVDVLEHITHEDGEALLARIPGYVVVCTPVEFFQNPEADEIPPEMHRSVWTVAEFQATGRLDSCQILNGGIVARLRPV